MELERRQRRTVGIGMIAAVALAMTACSFGVTVRPGEGRSTIVSTVPAEETPRPIAETDRYPQLAGIPAGTVLATGTFTGREADASGGVEIVAVGSNSMKIRLVDADFGEDRRFTIEFNSLADTATADELRVALSLYDKYEVRQGSSEFQTVVRPEFATTDPSWMRTVAIWAYEGDYHFGSLIGTAALTWTMPDMRPDLAIQDTGSTRGAYGQVLQEDGVPTGYKVARQDVLSAIAERLGVEISDLVWLNPGRGDHDARADEILNLSRERRGLRG